MKWIYGKQDWKTLERGEENCYLMTNGLGGFSSLTMTGSVARNDHALLMASIKAPNNRVNMVHRLKEELELQFQGEHIHAITLSSQEFADGSRENGYTFLSAFTYEDTPVWKFHVNGVEIIKEAGMQQGTNTIALTYEIRNRSKACCKLSITPFFQFVEKGSDMNMNQHVEIKGNKISSRNLSLYFRTNGNTEEFPEMEETYFYRYDVCDGRREHGKAKTNHKISIEIKPGSTGTLELIYEMVPSKMCAKQIISELKSERTALEQRAGLVLPLAKVLAKSAAQFIASRESTGGATILAGFPFFEDWGRDTMIALPGVCLSTGQYNTAKEILRTFAVNEKDGLMPNLFPEGKNEPMYNTVDAALSFINCVYLYYEATVDEAFVTEMYPVMKRIIEGYCRGTHFGIYLAEDGLIQSGEGLAQVTWMDVRVGERLPTPRHGKPVEINAYWYNALRIMEKFAGQAGDNPISYAEMAQKAKTAFIEKFWLEEKGCLKDLLSGTSADTQIRCNQIWAVSLPFQLLDSEKEKRVVETVFEKLYTPYGLRTLEIEDSEFHPYYGGAMEERDMAYHQGTVWTFPLGGYYLAYLKVNDYSETAKNIVKEQLEVLESAMREGCIGQLPEIYDGGNPVSSKGCFAQAWSVGELLRVYEAIEQKGGWQ